MLEIDITIDYPPWNEQIKDLEEYCDELMSAVIAKTNLIKAEHIEISLVLTNDAAVQKLNKEYRQKDKATNVLSFPNHDLTTENLNPEFVNLGDIIIAFETINRESEEQEKPFKEHFAHMLTHGTLHLLGHDHMQKAEQEIMEDLEIKILKQFNIANPYL
jgi:probable rRNA maturation factor